MLHCNAGRAWAGTVVVVMVLACSSGDKAPGEDSTLPTVAVGEDSTLSYVGTNNGTCEVDHSTLSGEIDTDDEIKEGLKQAKNLTKKGKSDKHGGSTISPICTSHEYNMPGKPQLDLGQFVAVIDIVGVDEKYSTEQDDVVYQWIYWDDSSQVYRAQFLSTKGKSVSATGSFGGCPKQPAKAEEAHWTPREKCGSAPMLPADLSQHTPWWGCWLGCCYVSDIESA